MRFREKNEQSINNMTSSHEDEANATHFTLL